MGQQSARDTDSLLPAEEQLGWPKLPAEAPIGGERIAGRKVPLAELMRPTINLAAEWQPAVGGLGMEVYEARIRQPTFPIFGPPPPFLQAGVSYRSVSAPLSLGLPQDLYDYALGTSWMRPVNDRWLVRFMFSAALATDGRNTSADAIQYRGGIFAIYRPDPAWSWIFGAIALGRNDIPVVPAVGVIWQPHPGLKYELTLPKPRVAWLLAERNGRQQWTYLAAGFTGGTWAFEDRNGTADQITYRDWRCMVGWESIPAAPTGAPYVRGRKLAVEAGYLFSRQFEFESDAREIGLENTLLLRLATEF